MEVEHRFVVKERSAKMVFRHVDKKFKIHVDDEEILSEMEVYNDENNNNL